MSAADIQEYAGVLGCTVRGTGFSYPWSEVLRMTQSDAEAAVMYLDEQITALNRAAQK